MKRIICLLLALLLLAGSASAESLKTTLGVPDHVNLSFTTNTGVTTITIDAPVEMPDVESVTTYELVPRALTEEEALRIVHALGYTQVPEVRYELDDPYADGSAYWDWDIVQAGYWDRGQYPEDRDPDTVWFSGRNWHGRGYTSHFQYINWEHWKIQYIASNTCPLSRVPQDVVPLEEATRLAVDLAAVIAPELRLHLTCGVPGDQTIYGLTDEEMQANYDPDMVVPAAYAFYFTREMDGIPVTPFNVTWLGVVEAQRYGPIVNQETLCIIVTENGLWRIEMGNPYTVTGAMEESLTDLVSFETIINVAQTILPLKYVSREGELGDDRVVIDRITFGYARMKVPYDEEKFMLVPVWDFFGNTMMSVPHYNEATGKFDIERMLNDQVDRPVLTINALNGLVFDREYDY